MPREQPIITVDAFTATPFGGNPAAVCVLAADLGDAVQQALAAEMALSETAFVRVLDRAAGRCALRWFTPTCEVNLCGHATLATAHALLEGGHVAPDAAELTFDTLSGVLRVQRVDGGMLRLDLPVGQPKALPEPPVAAALCKALGGLPEPIAAAYCARTKKLLLEFPRVQNVLDAAGDSAALLALQWPAGIDARGVIVTARSADASERGAHDGCAVVSRYFAPWNGIPEDPVTGSAHTVIAAYYAPTLGKTFRARQASKRGGTLVVSLDGAPDDRVFISGTAVTVLRGTVALPE